MKRLLVALAILGLASGAQAQVGGSTFQYTPSTGTQSASLGAELAPALSAANWTCAADWDCSVDGVLNHNAAGTSTPTPTVPLVMTAGTTYRVDVTFGTVSVAGTLTVNVGGASATPITAVAATTSTVYITAASTASPYIQALPAGSRFTVVGFSLRALTNGTGDLDVQGNLFVRSPAYFDSPLLLSDGSITAPSLAFANQTGLGLYTPAAGAIGIEATSVYFNPVGTAAGTNSLRLTSGASGGMFAAATLAIGFTSGSATASGDTFLYRDAANTLALRNAGTAGTPVPQTFNVYNFCDGAACATGYERAELAWSSSVFIIGTTKAGTGNYRNIGFSLNGGAQYYMNAATNSFYAATTDVGILGLASGPTLWQSLYLSRSIQGSKSKTVVDNSATAFVRVTVADDDYEACGFGWTAYAEDADTDARQVRVGRTNVSILNNSGTETATFSASTDDQAVTVTAGTLTVGFSSASTVADTIDLSVTVNTSLDAAAETLTFEYRLDCQSTITTITPL